MKKRQIQIILFALFAGFIFQSCIDENFDVPELPDPCLEDHGLTPNINIQQVKDLYASLDVVLENVKSFPADSNLVLEAIVVSSDREGNFYKEIYIQDETGAMVISIEDVNMYNKFDVGQTVQIKLSGLYIEFNTRKSIYALGLGLYENTSLGRIPALMYENYMFRKSCPHEVEPQLITLDEVSGDLLGKLVKVENVEIAEKDTNGTYAVATTNPPQGLSIDVSDCEENMIILRTSGYAGFASVAVPNGNGSITAILTKYNSDYQLIIRDTSDVQLNQPRCNASLLLNEGFANGLGVFTAYNVLGEQVWQQKTYDNGCAVMSGHVGNNDYANEDWLISPAMNFEAVTNPKMNFRHAVNYITSWNDLKVLVSTDYDGTSSPAEQGNWTELSGYFKPQGNSWDFFDSGDVDLSAYAGESSVYIAFKFTSSNTDSSTWEIGEVIIE